MKYRSIALDGPSGAGKSTLAKMTAGHLGFIYVDTGAIYRSVGLYAHRKGVDTRDPTAVTALLPDVKLELKYESGAQKIFLNGENVSEAIRMPEISMCASNVSAIPAVRAFLLDMQREMARNNDVIMDGRDIGTVVLPGADVKIFLTASAEDRAMRRYEELKAKGVDTGYEEVLADMRRRDEQDASRAAAPLKKAEDAIELDTTGNTLEESFRQICTIISERLKV